MVDIVKITKWSIDCKDERSVKQDESNGDLEFIMTIEFGGKLASWKWTWICRVYKNPIFEFDVGQTSSNNRGKAYGTQVFSTTRGGMVGSMD